MRVPIYVVSGFLDSGKTSFINQMIGKETEENFKKKGKGKSRLILQFESGDEELNVSTSKTKILQFSKKDLEKPLELLLEKINTTLTQGFGESNQQIQSEGLLPRVPWDEIWIEYNGMELFSKLYRIIGLLSAPGQSYYVERVIHLLDYPSFDSLLGRTGASLPEQIGSSDLIVGRNITTIKEKSSLKTTLKNLNGQAEFFDSSEMDKIKKKLNQKKIQPLAELGIAISCLTVIFALLWRVLQGNSPALNTIVNIFLGIAFQAVPFLLIGVLISSFIQVFISREAIERIFPKNMVGGILTALFAGFFLPVCDCASIPIFRSLVKKGVPLPAAVTFMTATPVINPVVMLSTYYAFNGNLRIVFTRVGLGMIAAVLIGLIFYFLPSRLTESFSERVDGALCSCGCYEGTDNIESLSGKISLMIRHSQIEFFNVGKYLMLGALFTAVLQTTLSKSFATATGSELVLSLGLLMLMAFLLSLCSSSDAVIARSLANRFSLTATMGFLVFGPMMDIKNVLLLSGYFPKKFIGKLVAVTAIVSFVVVLVFSGLFLGV